MHTTINRLQLLNGYPRTGHMASSCMTSSQVTKRFMSITPHRIEGEPRARCHCVFPVKMHRMLCNIDLPWSFMRSGHSTWREVKFWNWPFGVKMHMCRFVLTWGIRCCLTLFSIFLSLNVICKKVDLPKKATTCPGKVKMWPKVVKSDIVIFRVSRSFRLSLLRSSISIRGQMSRPPGAV